MFFEITFEYFISGYDGPMQHSTVIYIEESNNIIEILNTIINKCNEIFDNNSYQDPRIKSIILVSK